jgi:glycosyltransferase involved in cell wall biosynthesis
MRNQITPLILTYNEAPNIGRTLKKLSWAQRIVVIDSGSTDDTLEILWHHPKVEVIHRSFTDFTSQWNFGLTKVLTPWVLSLDADYELSDELVRELGSLVPLDSADGYRASFVQRIYGRPLRDSLYPPRTVLFRRDKAFYRQEGHTQRAVIDGKVLSLRGVIYHDDRKPLARWLMAQQRYAREEAEYLRACRRDQLPLADRVRLMGWPAPLAVLLYVLFVKRSLLDGWPGWFYALQRVLVEAMLALELMDRRLGCDHARPLASPNQKATREGMRRLGHGDDGFQ